MQPFFKLSINPLNNAIVKTVETSSRHILCIHRIKKEIKWLSESSFRNQFLNINAYNKTDIYWPFGDDYVDEPTEIDEHIKFNLNPNPNFYYGDIYVKPEYYICGNKTEIINICTSDDIEETFFRMKNDYVFNILSGKPK